MNDLLEKVLESTNFLTPYLKQFAKYFKPNAKLVELASTSNKYINILKELEINIEPYTNQTNVDGVLVVHTNNYEDNIDDLINIINSILKEEGYVFFVIRNKTNIMERLEYHLLDKYIIEEEFISDDNWKFILYKKSTIK